MVLVLVLDPVSLDLPITKEVQEFNFGPTNWVWQAVSAPGYSPYILSAANGANGAVSIINNKSQLSYMPNSGFMGVDSFNYTITDTRGETATPRTKAVEKEQLPQSQERSKIAQEKGENLSRQRERRI